MNTYPSDGEGFINEKKIMNMAEYEKVFEAINVWLEKEEKSPVFFIVFSDGRVKFNHGDRTFTMFHIDKFENKEELERFGFVFSDAGETSVTLLAVPQVNGSALKSAFLHDVLEFLSGSEEARPNDWFRDAIAQSACKHAVKAGERLSHEEIQKLLEKLKDRDTLLTCPHGRPVAIRFTKTDIEKMFKRIL